jgi:hypothetical protein
MRWLRSYLDAVTQQFKKRSQKKGHRASLPIRVS